MEEASSVMMIHDFFMFLFVYVMLFVSNYKGNAICIECETIYPISFFPIRSLAFPQNRSLAFHFVCVCFERVATVALEATD